jgi:hypothetical protein
VKRRIFRGLTTEMPFRPRHVYHPLGELTAWYHDLWPSQRLLLHVSVTVPTLLVAVFLVTNMPDLHQDDAKIQANRLLMSADYEDYEPTEQELAEDRLVHSTVATPAKYTRYVSNTRKQTNRHRRHRRRHNK